MKGIILTLVTSIIAFSGISQNEFAFDMYSKMDTKSNLLFSPSSIKTAFAMAYEGANNQTQLEFENVFGFEEDNDKFLAEIEDLKAVSEISNSTWILKKYNILKSYRDKMKSSFDAEPYFTDFKNDPEGSAKKINNWIEKSTNGMIKKMLEPGDVEETKMALINAIYFKQDWKNPFDEELTKKEKFKNLNGAKVEVDMMHSLTTYRAFEGKKELVVELPYEDDKTSMVIILPNKMDGYELTNESYTQLTSRLSYQKVDLDLPKFTFETPAFELNLILQKMGLVQAFTDFADFSGMRAEKDLKIGAALHKAKIIVDEEGTEAAAVTVIMMIETTSMSSHRPEPILKINVDKPFYYFIKDAKTGAVLFMGRMNEL